MAADLSQFRNRSIKRVDILLCNLAWSSRVDKHVDVLIVFVIINSQYVFALGRVAGGWSSGRFTLVSECWKVRFSGRSSGNNPGLYPSGLKVR